LDKVPDLQSLKKAKVGHLQAKHREVPIINQAELSKAANEFREAVEGLGSERASAGPLTSKARLKEMSFGFQ
jgi:hypothetical protein